MRQKIGVVAEHGNDEDAEKENEHRMVIGSRQRLALQALRIAVDVITILRILDERLEFRIFIEILAAAVAPESRADHARQGRGNRHAEDLQNGHLMSRLRHKGDDGDDGYRNRRATNAHLGGDGRHGHRTLGADALLDGDIVDNRKHRVDDMPRAAEHGQKPRRDRCKDRDLLRVVAQELLRVLEHDREAA